MKRCMCIFLFLAGLMLQGKAQIKLSGKVTDENAVPLSGAHLRLKEIAGGSISRTDGSFEFLRLKAGNYTLIASFVGHAQIEYSLRLTGDTSVEVVLPTTQITENEVIVYASRASASMPVAVSNIGTEELNRQNQGNELPFILQLSPSFVATSENGTMLGNTAFRIRGSDPSRMNVTINGVPLNDAESQAVFWVNMTDFGESVESVQIQRGVGTSANGSAAFGASLNFQTVSSQHPYARLKSTAGSFGTLKNSIAVGSGLLNRHFSFDARASLLHSDGYMKHSALDHNSLFFSGSFQNDKTLVKVVVWTNQEHTGMSWWGVPDYMIETDRRFNPSGVYYDSKGEEKYYNDQKDNYLQTHAQLHASTRISKSLQWQTTLHYTHGKGYYEQYMDDQNPFHATQFTAYGLPGLMSYTSSHDTLTGSDLVNQRWLDNNFYGLSTSFVVQKKQWEFIAGASANRYNGHHFGNIQWVEFNPGIEKGHEYYRNASEKTEWNAFAKALWKPTARLSLFADIQQRTIHYTLKGLTDDQLILDQSHPFSFFNPKTGIQYQNGHHTVFGYWGIARREPTRENFKYALGDAEAMPEVETMFDYEAGYTFRSRQLTASVNLFWMNYLNQLVPTGEMSDVGYVIMTNVNKSYRAGIELEATGSPVSWLTIQGNTTLSNNKITNFVEHISYYDEQWNFIENRAQAPRPTDLAYSPSIIGAISLIFKPSKWSEVILTTKHVGQQYFDNTSEAAAKIEAYTVSDLVLNLTPKLSRIVETRFFLRVNNLLDQEYISNAYGGKDIVNNETLRWTYYFPQPGINLLAGLNLEF